MRRKKEKFIEGRTGWLFLTESPAFPKVRGGVWGEGDRSRTTRGLRGVSPKWLRTARPIASPRKTPRAIDDDLEIILDRSGER